MREDGSTYSTWKGWGTFASFAVMQPGSADYFRRELRSLRTQGKDLDVLEVGFGDGEFLSYGRSLGWSMTGTEISEVLIEAGKVAGFEVHAPEYLDGVPEESFDLIVAFDVFEHIPQGDAVEFLSQLAAKLRPSGRILMRFPNADSWLGAPMQNGDPTHVSAIGYFKLTWFAQESGLRIREFRAPVRRGFRTSFVHGFHRMVVGPLVALIATLAKAIYFPGLPLVLSSSNVIAVLERDTSKLASPVDKATTT